MHAAPKCPKAIKTERGIGEKHGNQEGEHIDPEAPNRQPPPPPGENLEADDRKLASPTTTSEPVVRLRMATVNKHEKSH